MSISTRRSAAHLALPVMACLLATLRIQALDARETPKGTIAVLNASSCIDRPHLKALEALGKVVVYDDTDTAAKARERLRGVKVAIAQPFTAPLDRSVLDAGDSLELLVLCTTGYDLVDLTAATRNGIQVANVPGYSSEAVAEHTLALMLAVSRKIPASDAAVRRHPFEVDEGVPAHRPFRGFDLAGKTLGIIGFGKIGSRVAEIARGFGMKVLVWNRSQKDVEAAGATQTTIEELLRQSDVVSLHLALTRDTEKFLSASRLMLMKPTAVLINTARGRLIDESALLEALQSGQLAGAGLDVLDDMTPGNPLLKLPNVVLSPHSAYYTQESMSRRSDEIVAAVKAFISGSPINIVNGRAGSARPAKDGTSNSRPQ